MCQHCNCRYPLSIIRFHSPTQGENSQLDGCGSSERCNGCEHLPSKYTKVKIDSKAKDDNYAMKIIIGNPHYAEVSYRNLIDFIYIRVCVLTKRKRFKKIIIKKIPKKTFNDSLRDDIIALAKKEKSICLKYPNEDFQWKLSFILFTIKRFYSKGDEELDNAYNILSNKLVSETANN